MFVKMSKGESQVRNEFSTGKIRQTFGELDFADIAKELSARQMYDNFKLI